jgi:hypothetical protein
MRRARRAARPPRETSEQLGALIRSRGRGERLVQEVFPGATIIRRSAMFGPGDALFGTVAQLARMLPALPLIGEGRTRWQPVLCGGRGRAHYPHARRPGNGGRDLRDRQAVRSPAMYDDAQTSPVCGCSNELLAPALPVHLFWTASRNLIHWMIFQRETTMKYILILSILAASLGGCVLAPAGYDDNRGGYYQDHGYNHGDGNFRNYNSRERGN